MNEFNGEKRRRRSTEQWQQLIASQTESGLSQREFCARESIPLGSFCNAKRRLRVNGNARVGAQSDFVSLSPMPAPASSGWEVELSVGDGVIIRVRGG